MNSHVLATIVKLQMAINLELSPGGNPTAFALIDAMSATNNFVTTYNPVKSKNTGPPT